MITLEQIKTLINGLKLIIPPWVKPDLTENDKSSPNYVKGRTHWTGRDGTIHRLNEKYLPEKMPERYLEEVKQAVDVGADTANAYADDRDGKLRVFNSVEGGMLPRGYKKIPNVNPTCGNVNCIVRQNVTQNNTETNSWVRMEPYSTGYEFIISATPPSVTVFLDAFLSTDGTHRRVQLKSGSSMTLRRSNDRTYYYIGKPNSSFDVAYTEDSFSFSTVVLQLNPGFIDADEFIRYYPANSGDFEKGWYINTSWVIFWNAEVAPLSLVAIDAGSQTLGTALEKNALHRGYMSSLWGQSIATGPIGVVRSLVHNSQYYDSGYGDSRYEDHFRYVGIKEVTYEVLMPGRYSHNVYVSKASYGATDWEYKQNGDDYTVLWCVTYTSIDTSLESITFTIWEEYFQGAEQNHQRILYGIVHSRVERNKTLLPASSTADNNKVLKIIGGVPTWAESIDAESAEGVSF